jgi:hypothetical protein
MLEKLYELLMSFVTFILGFFGIELGKKSVTFADEEGSKGEESKSSEPTSTDGTS